MPQDEHRIVLLVDDEPIVIRAFQAAFRGQQECLLDLAQKLPEAMAKLAHINYDLIWLDMRLEGASYAGMDVLRELNKIKREARRNGHRLVDTRVVIMSGSVPLSDVMWEASELGVISFWAKPVSGLEEAVRRALSMTGVPVPLPLTSVPEGAEWPP